MEITNIHAREIFNSRGIPTVECSIILSDGMELTASVPSGISLGIYEVFEKRDGGNRLNGLGVCSVVDGINNIIAPIFLQREPDVVSMDIELLELDGTSDKSNFGANALLAVSIALCKAQAYTKSVSVYELIAYLCGNESIGLPCPMFNVLGGGLHADNNFIIQELLAVPLGSVSFHEAMDIGAIISYTLRSILKTRGIIPAVGYEGEFIPLFSSVQEPFDIIMEAIIKLGYEDKVVLAIDVAASSFYNQETGLYAWYGKNILADDLIDWYKELIKAYPLYFIEDGLSQTDWNNWKILKKELGNSVQLIGDDLFATNSQRIWDGIQNDVATAALIKPNQIGTISEMLQAIILCKENDWDVIVSHRSGETNDSFIADLAVGVSAQKIKAGNCIQGEHLAKYNRLLQIEDELNVF